MAISLIRAKGRRATRQVAGGKLIAELERIKWKLWHGNVVGVRQVIGDFETDLFELETDYPNLSKSVTAAREFAACVASNASSLINYGERISSALVEATVMRW